jgi:protein-disulfide isomerase
VTIQRVSVAVLAAVLCFAQGDWKTGPAIPGVDLTGLSKPQRDLALSILRSEGCACGCDMKIGQCRVEDPKCAVSRKLTDLVLKESSEGKSAKDIRADLAKLASEPPPLLSEPVKISIDGDPMRGPSTARVTIVEFSDFQCPFCARAVSEATAVLAKFPKDVRLVFKQYPLDTHSQAALAAEAALAAQAQGKFWELHDKMYANFRSISRDRIFVWAKEIGLDLDKLRADLDSHKFAARVSAESHQGDNAGVEGTPTFFIDGKRLNTTFDVATVTPLIQAELKH